jgi:hypothetical protein
MGSELIEGVADPIDQASLLGQQEDGAGADDLETSGERNRTSALLIDKKIHMPLFRQGDGHPGFSESNRQRLIPWTKQRDLELVVDLRRNQNQGVEILEKREQTHLGHPD